MKGGITMWELLKCSQNKRDGHPIDSRFKL